MTTKQFIAIEKELLSGLAGFVVEKRLMILLPVNHLLRGINFQPSTFNKTSFSVTTFMMPLFIPSPHLTMNFAQRVRQRESGDRWEADMPGLIRELGGAIKKQALPLLSSVQSLSDFVKMARQTSLHNPHTLRAIAFALALDGEMQEAIKVIDELILRLDLNVPWQVEIRDTVKTLKTIIVASPSEAKLKLLGWEAESIRNLELTCSRV